MLAIDRAGNEDPDAFRVSSRYVMTAARRVRLNDEEMPGATAVRRAKCERANA
jgi:hypothetical protein